MFGPSHLIKQSIHEHQQELERLGRLQHRHLQLSRETAESTATTIERLSDSLHQVLSSMEGDSGLGKALKVSEHILEQTHSAFQKAIQHLSRFNSDVNRLHVQSRTTLDNIHKIRTLSTSTRLLAFNARIESGRDKDDQQSLTALAVEMKAISRQINEAASQIENINKSTRDNIANSTQQVSLVIEEFEIFAKEIIAEKKELQRATSFARDDLHRLIRRIHGHTNSIISSHRATLNKKDMEQDSAKTREALTKANKHLASALELVLEELNKTDKITETRIVKLLTQHFEEPTNEHNHNHHN